MKNDYSEYLKVGGLLWCDDLEHFVTIKEIKRKYFYLCSLEPGDRWADQYAEEANYSIEEFCSTGVAHLVDQTNPYGKPLTLWWSKRAFLTLQRRRYLASRVYQVFKEFDEKLKIPDSSYHVELSRIGLMHEIIDAFSHLIEFEDGLSEN